MAKLTPVGLARRRAAPECATLEELHEQTRQLYESITARAEQVRDDSRRTKHRKRRARPA